MSFSLCPLEILKLCHFEIIQHKFHWKTQRCQSPVLAIIDPCQILTLVMSKFERINQFLFPLKWSKNLWFINTLILKAKFSGNPLFVLFLQENQIVNSDAFRQRFIQNTKESVLHRQMTKKANRRIYVYSRIVHLEDHIQKTMQVL